MLDRTANGFRAVDVVTLPSGFTGMGGWHVADGRLTVSAARGDGTGEDVAFVWNGRYFQR